MALAIKKACASFHVFGTEGGTVRDGEEGWGTVTKGRASDRV